MVKAGLSRRRFWFWLGTWTALGLAIRLGTVFGRPHRQPGGDPAYFHSAANYLVAGRGFINPWLCCSQHHHQIVQTAAWPPLFVFVLAIPVVFGFHSFFASRIFCCLIGAAGIVVTGLAGREISGWKVPGREVTSRRIGLVAAFLLAVYPNVWDNAELATVETLVPLLIAGVLWTSYRLWREPTLRNAVLAGVCMGLAVLGRDELVLLIPLILVPVVFVCRQVALRRRFLMVLVAVGATLVLVMPWVGYNMSRFKDPVFVSTGLGTTLASANCDQTYSGRWEGYWSYQCALRAPRSLKVDESVNSANDQAYALKYVKHHLGRLPYVIAARIGRGFGFFHPLDQIKVDSTIETRPYHWALVGLAMYYVLLPLSIGGTILLRRRRVMSFPLWAIGLDVVISMAITFGQTRYRASFESSLVLLAAVQLEWFWARMRRKRPESSTADGSDALDSELAAVTGSAVTGSAVTGSAVTGSAVTG